MLTFKKVILLMIFLTICNPNNLICNDNDCVIQELRVSDNGRFLQFENGEPFFWLGDTGWLLFKKLDRTEAELYFEDRKNKGFNVIQAMVIHDIRNTSNVYGDFAVSHQNVAMPVVTDGRSFENPDEYDYWDHVDFIIDKAGEKGIFMALVPIWGSNVRGGHVTQDQAKIYATFLAERYKDKSNIIWLNGGDVRGSDNTEVWKTLGKTLSEIDTKHLITFHPFGRTMSSEWFHNEAWLDFNMFQSGHRSYEQDDTERGYGPDSWRYVLEDYMKDPIKPTIDGEPSYEHIPVGLHDRGQEKWTEDDARRYAYWSVFAGAFGHTYGHGSVMQFYTPGDADRNFGVNISWKEALDSSGDHKYIHLKNLILSKPFLERVPDQSLIAGQNGSKYDYVIATRGQTYALIYTYTGRAFDVVMGKISGSEVKASWFNPNNGETTFIGHFENSATLHFDPPGDEKPGNDWVLILDRN